MEQGLSVRKQRGEVLPISPADAKAWEVVQTVLDWMGDTGSYNYSEAFRQTGVERYAYYRAIKRPFVQGRLLDRMDALDKAAVRLIEQRWPGILQNMARIAEGQGREAVQAARFLAQQKERLQETVEEKEQKGPSQAALLLQRAREMPKTVRATRTTVREEVVLTRGSDGGEVVIDG